MDNTFNKCLTEVDDNISKRFFDSDLNWEHRITDSEICQNALISEAEQHQEARVTTIIKATGELESWRHELEGAVDDLKLKVNKLMKYWDRSFLDNATVSTGLISPSPHQLEQTATRSLAGITAAWPSGHHDASITQVDGIGENSTQSHSPTNGTHSEPKPKLSLFHGVAYDEHTRNHPNETNPTNLGKLPKQNFPIYEGETTRLWISQAKDYFDMYEVPPC